MRHIQLNEIIKASKGTKELDTNLLSDGYHTFGELYDHRIALFIAFANYLYANLLQVSDDKGAESQLPWKSKLHHDGTMYEGWFVAGIGKEKGEQISYHLPMKDWEKLEVDELETAPEWDGHTPADVVERLLKL